MQLMETFGIVHSYWFTVLILKNLACMHGRSLVKLGSGNNYVPVTPRTKFTGKQPQRFACN